MTNNNETITGITFGITSIGFAGLQAIVYIVDSILSDGTPWELSIILVLMALTLAGVGFALSIVGMTRSSDQINLLSFIGFLSNAAVLVLAVLGWLIWALSQYA